MEECNWRMGNTDLSFVWFMAVLLLSSNLCQLRFYCGPVFLCLFLILSFKSGFHRPIEFYFMYFLISWSMSLFNSEWYIKWCLLPFLEDCQLMPQNNNHCKYRCAIGFIGVSNCIGIEKYEHGGPDPDWRIMSVLINSIPTNTHKKLDFVNPASQIRDVCTVYVNSVSLAHLKARADRLSGV